MPASSCCLSFYAPALCDHVQCRHAGMGVEMPAGLLVGGTCFWHCRLKLPNVLLHRLYHFPVIRGVGIFGIFRPFVPSRSDGTPYGVSATEARRRCRGAHGGWRWVAREVHIGYLPRWVVGSSRGGHRVSREVFTARDAAARDAIHRRLSTGLGEGSLRLGIMLSQVVHVVF